MQQSHPPNSERIRDDIAAPPTHRSTWPSRHPTILRDRLTAPGDRLADWADSYNRSTPRLQMRPVPARSRGVGRCLLAGARLNRAELSRASARPCGRRLRSARGWLTLPDWLLQGCERLGARSRCAPEPGWRSVQGRPVVRVGPQACLRTRIAVSQGVRAPVPNVADGVAPALTT
jgi:hypothetical protein